MNNLEIFLEELNNVETLHQRLTIKLINIKLKTINATNLITLIKSLLKLFLLYIEKII